MGARNSVGNELRGTMQIVVMFQFTAQVLALKSLLEQDLEHFQSVQVATRLKSC